MLPAGLALLLLFGLWSTIDPWRLRRLPPALTVAALHHRLYRHARRLRAPLGSGDTPYEFAASVVDHMTTLTMRKLWRGYIAAAPQEVKELTDLYIRASYSPHHLEEADQVRAIRLWRRLRGRLWLAWLDGRPADEGRPKTGE